MKSRKRERGLTLVELIIAMAILAVAIMALVSSITSSGQIQQNTRERVIAYNAAREQIEKMRVYAVGEIVSRYNASSADDGNFTGAHPGNTFHVPRLGMPTKVPATWSAYVLNKTWDQTNLPLDSFGNALGHDGVGIITFPEVAPGILSEQYIDEAMGMPETSPGSGVAVGKDLNRNGSVNETSVNALSVKILPVKVTVRWKSIGGRDTEIEMNTFITDK